MSKEEKLTNVQMNCLNDQVMRFNNLMKQKINSNSVDKPIILPQNTLIHITDIENNVIKSISETGIITGQAVGLKNSEATNYCANFYKLLEESNIEKISSFLNNDKPFEINLKEKIAFIIYPNEKLNELLKYDFYANNTKEGNITKTFSNVKSREIDLKNKKDLSQSSILFGIPSNFITALVITDKSIMLDKINFLMNIFKNIPIIRSNGEFIYNIGDSYELIEERIIRIQNEIELLNIERNIQFIETKLYQTEKELLKIKQAINSLPDKYKKEITSCIEK